MTVRSLTLTIVLAAFMLSATWADEPAPAPAAKTAVPGAAAIKEARKLVDEIYADEIAKANVPLEKVKLSQKLLKAAGETQNDVAGKYVLLSMAKDLAAGGGDAETAFAAIAELDHFRIDALKMEMEALVASVKYVRSRDAKALADRINVVIDEAIASDRYDIAGQTAQLSASLAKTAKELDAIKAANARAQEVKSAESAYAGVKKALGVLVDKPKDPEANLLVGQYYCLKKGLWDKGLPMLSMGSDAALKALAEKELAKPTDAKEQVELGDGWWDVATKENAAAQGQVKQHAREWYDKALPDLTGLVKAKVEKRVANVPANANQKELVLDLGNNVTMKLVLIPAGKFLMGSLEGEKHRSREEGPQHAVTIRKPFHMGIYTITQEQYEQITGENPSHVHGAQNPAVMVSWKDAVDFCEKLSTKTGKTVKLPTEAQWEYACRAGSKTRFSFGDDNEYAKLTDYAWYNRNSDNKAHPVGQKKPNAWGLYDMHGNVGQWCSDWYGEGYYSASGNDRDPQGPRSGTKRVVRGGSWGSAADISRSALRGRAPTDVQSDNIGFRVIVEAK